MQTLSCHAAGTTPSDEALRVYYEGLDVQETFDVLKPKIIDVVKQRRVQKAKIAYLAGLKGQAKVEIKMAQPRAHRLTSRRYSGHRPGAAQTPQAVKNLVVADIDRNRALAQ